jgi:hypothetical protein
VFFFVFVFRDKWPGYGAWSKEWQRRNLKGILWLR